MIHSMNSSQLMADNQNIHIAVVDMKLIFNSYTQKKKAQIKLDTLKKNFIKSIYVKKKKIKELERQFESKEATLNQAQIRRRLDKIELQKEKLNDFIKKRSVKLKKLEEKLKRPMLRKILKIIEKIRQERKLDIILDKGDVLSYSLKVDLTHEIIKRLKFE